jgi:CRP-like cAMP-binding protein
VWEVLLEVGIRRAFSVDELIVRQGGPVSVLVILSGYVKKSRVSPDGYEVLHDVLAPGQLYGHEAVVSGDDVSAFSLQAATQVTVLQLVTARFLELMRGSPDLALAVAADLARQVEEQARRLQGQTDQPVGRIVNILLTLANSAGTPRKGAGNTVELEVPLAQSDIASLAMVSRATALRALNDLRSRDVVRLMRRRLIITDLAALAELANPDARP